MYESASARRFAQSAVLLALLLFPLSFRSQAADSRPNFVVIMADDLGIECLRSYGGSSYKTPVLDALARDGTQWNNCFSTPLCTPSRVQILTGRYPFRTSWNQLIDNRPRGKQYMNPYVETTFGNLLRDAGYRTAVAGKWQLCHFEDYPRHAKVCGFDEHLLWIWKDNERRMPRYWDAMMWRNGKRFVPNPNKYAPDLCTDWLIRFMKRNKDGPFLAYFPMLLPHGPHLPTPFDSPTAPRKVQNKRFFASMDHYKDNLGGNPRALAAVHLIVTPEYLRRMTKQFPNLHIFAIRLDRGLSDADVLQTRPGARPDDERGLTDNQYIVPGAGGVGEVLNNAWI